MWFSGCYPSDRPYQAAIPQSCAVIAGIWSCSEDNCMGGPWSPLFPAEYSLNWNMKPIYGLLSTCSQDRLWHLLNSSVLRTQNAVSYDLCSTSIFQRCHHGLYTRANLSLRAACIQWFSTLDFGHPRRASSCCNIPRCFPERFLILIFHNAYVAWWSSKVRHFAFIH